MPAFRETPLTGSMMLYEWAAVLTSPTRLDVTVNVMVRYGFDVGGARCRATRGVDPARHSLLSRRRSFTVGGAAAAWPATGTRLVLSTAREN